MGAVCGARTLNTIPVCIINIINTILVPGTSQGVTETCSEQRKYTVSYLRTLPGTGTERKITKNRGRHADPYYPLIFSIPGILV